MEEVEKTYLLLEESTSGHDYYKINIEEAIIKEDKREDYSDKKPGNILDHRILDNNMKCL